MDDCASIDDDMIIEVSMQAAMAGHGGGEDDYDLDFDDQTRIRDLADLPS